MAGQLIVPGGTEGDVLSPEQEAAIIVVRNLAPLLTGIQNQLETLIRMEAGVLHRTTVRKRIQAYDEAEKAAVEAQEEEKDDSEEG